MHPDLAFALELADLADRLTRERFRAADLRVDAKPNDTPVTDADQRVEQALRDRLRRDRPQHAVLGEEYGRDGGSEWCWLLDPIDGTKNFARGVPVWATLIALRHGEQTQCSVVSAPALHRRWLAAAGAGAQDGHGRRLHVSSIDELRHASFSCTDFRDFETPRHQRAFRTLTSRCRAARGFGDFWSHMLVAEGAVDVAMELGVSPWDVAPVELIVREAGGACTDIDGQPRIDTRSIVSSNGVLHTPVIEVMAARG